MSQTTARLYDNRLTLADKGERRPAVITRFTVSADGKLHEPKIWRGFVVNKYCEPEMALSFSWSW
jgi:hypothetical protein